MRRTTSPSISKSEREAIHPRSSTAAARGPSLAPRVARWLAWAALATLPVAVGCAVGSTGADDEDDDAAAPSRPLAADLDASTDTGGKIKDARPSDATADGDAKPETGRDAGTDASTDAKPDRGADSASDGGTTVDADVPIVDAGTDDSGATEMGPATWGTNAVAHRCARLERFAYICPPNGTAGNIYGNYIYSDDSVICTAAVHDGKISLSGGGRIVVEMRPGENIYRSATKNGISSQDYQVSPGQPSWPCSFVVWPW
jgi:hypothetical protein